MVFTTNTTWYKVNTTFSNMPHTSFFHINVILYFCSGEESVLYYLRSYPNLMPHSLGIFIIYRSMIYPYLDKSFPAKSHCKFQCIWKCLLTGNIIKLRFFAWFLLTNPGILLQIYFHDSNQRLKSFVTVFFLQSYNYCSII